MNWDRFWLGLEITLMFGMFFGMIYVAWLAAGGV